MWQNYFYVSLLVLIFSKNLLILGAFITHLGCDVTVTHGWFKRHGFKIEMFSKFNCLEWVLLMVIDVNSCGWEANEHTQLVSKLLGGHAKPYVAT